MYRQGDVLLILIDKKAVTDGAVIPRSRGRIILAHGEQTGHAHAVSDPHAMLLQTGSGRQLIVREQPVDLEHEEHKPIALRPGIYEVRSQRQYAGRYRTAGCGD